MPGDFIKYFVLHNFAVEDDDKRIPVRMAKIAILISCYPKRAAHIVQMTCRKMQLKICNDDTDSGDVFFASPYSRLMYAARVTKLNLARVGAEKGHWPGDRGSHCPN